MKIKLTLPYAENYVIPIPQKIMGSKAIYDFIKQALIQKHPGFSSESLWDYFFTKDAYGRRARVVVITKALYTEKRILEKNCIFYFETEDGKKIKMFSGFNFKRNGERRKWRICFFGIISFLVLSAAGFGIIKAMDTKHHKEETELPVVETLEVRLHKNMFDVINNCSFIFERHGIIINSLQFTSENSAVLDFSAEGKQSYELIKELNEADFVKKCICQNITYWDEKEAFEIKIETDLSYSIVPSEDSMALLEIQERLSDEFKRTGAQMLSSGIAQDDGRVTFLMSVTEGNLKSLNERLNILFTENNLYLLNFSENRNSTLDSYQVSIEGLLVNKNQIIENPEKEETLSNIFIGKKEGKEASITLKEDLSGVAKNNLNRIDGYKKIGTVKKNGKTFYYYRTPENKIYISEEE